MKLISEERYNISEINIQNKILGTLRKVKREEYSIDFFVSDTFLVIKIYKKENQ